MGKVKETLLCDDCGDAIIPESYEEVADDMLDFITDQVHWLNIILRQFVGEC